VRHPAPGSSRHRSGGALGGHSLETPHEQELKWHHIVEQTPGNVERFGSHALHNTRISALYSSIRLNITGSNSLTVRQWLSTQPYETQRKFGLLAVENATKGIW
jgi:hypothetical protein